MSSNTQMTTYRYWVCGRIDPRYDMALKGVFHAESIDDHGHATGRTLCGLPARPRETATTIWWLEDRGRLAPSCKSCRRAMGEEVGKWEKSLDYL